MREGRRSQRLRHAAPCCLCACCCCVLLLFCSPVDVVLVNPHHRSVRRNSRVRLPLRSTLLLLLLCRRRSSRRRLLCALIRIR